MDTLSYIYIFKWWIFVLFIGILNLPLTFYIFRKFTNFGWAFAKLLGILLSSYILFVLSVVKIAPFDLFSIYLCLSAVVVINLIVFNKNSNDFLTKARSYKWTILAEEVLFAFGLFFWSYVRGHQPDIEGLEKFMDFGFVNSSLRSNFLPPTDMWFAGKTINYYWFGHYITAFLIKLINVPASVGYNLMLATIMGLTLSQSFSFIHGVVRNFSSNLKLPLIAALMSALVLTFAGNFHTPYYVLKNGGDKYWYPDATRFIGYNPPVEDKTIHEFPLYSFVVADLHGHLLNLPIVLMFISIFGAYLIGNKNKFSLSYQIVPFGFLLGIMFMTSTWDFANYLLLTGSGYFFFSIFNKGNFLKTFFNALSSGIAILVLAIIFASPFIFNFESIAQGIRFTHTHTPIWQLAILWGYPAILTAVFSLVVIKFRKTILASDVFVVSVLAAGWTLIVLPEVIYVKDIYIASHYRANTMFKLTYQAFVMFYLSSGYIVFRVLSLVKNKLGKWILALYFASMLSSILVYPKYAIKSYYGKLGNFKTLNGELWVSTRLPEYASVIKWLRENSAPGDIILEAPGDSYTLYNVVSSYTGIPTVSGWFVHEWLWRGEAIFPQQRVTDITTIYTSTDDKAVKEQIKKYGVKYIIVGSQEREKFPGIQEQTFSTRWKTAANFGSTTIYEVPKM